MKIAISDLLFPGFSKYILKELDINYGIEFFYEFGKDYYWDNEIASWGKRSLSIHGPCVTVNLANKKQSGYVKVYKQTFSYAQKIKADFVVVHTNEDWDGKKDIVQARVIRRLRKLAKLAKEYNVQILIENVGLRTKNSLLFDCNDYLALFEEVPDAKALIDTGHAHVNGWDIPWVIETLNNKLFACHLHDNMGDSDAHLPISKGKISWEEYFSAIKMYAPQAVQVLEYSCGFKDISSLEKHIVDLKNLYNI